MNEKRGERESERRKWIDAESVTYRHRCARAHRIRTSRRQSEKRKRKEKGDKRTCTQRTRRDGEKVRRRHLQAVARREAGPLREGDDWLTTDGWKFGERDIAAYRRRGRRVGACAHLSPLTGFVQRTPCERREVIKGECEGEHSPNSSNYRYRVLAFISHQLIKLVRRSPSLAGLIGREFSIKSITNRLCCESERLNEAKRTPASNGPRLGQNINWFLIGLLNDLNSIVLIYIKTFN